MIRGYYKNQLLRDARDEIIGEMWNQLDGMEPSDKKPMLKTFDRKMKSAGMTPNDVANYYGLNGSDGRIFFRDVVQYLDYWIDRLDPELGTYCWPFVEIGADPEIVGWKAVTTHLREVLPDLAQPQEATTADLPVTDDEEEERTVVHAVEEVLGQAAAVLGDLLAAIKTGSTATQIQAVAVATQLLGGAVGNDSGQGLPAQYEVRLAAKPFADRLRNAKQEILLAMALQPAYEEYQEQLEASGFVDHTDIIIETAKAFEDGRGDVVAEKYSHVVVDEFQDSTAMQFTIADAMAGDADEITMGGDHCQSLYEWRTAFRENFTVRPERVYDDLTEEELKANRRSCSDIRDVVNTLLDHARTDIKPVDQDDPANIPVAQVRPVIQPNTTDGRQGSD
jgi:ATP-dependent exoDNAse (exonuclease V) beta subunit